MSYHQRKEANDEFIDGTDDIRERVFSEMNVKTFLKTGAAVPKEDQMEAILKDKWGDTPLRNSLKPKGKESKTYHIYFYLFNYNDD